MADDVDDVLAVAASDLAGAAEPTWQAVDRSSLQAALERLLAEPDAHAPLAQALAVWVDPRLPETPAEVTREEPFDVDDARLMAGWTRVVNDAFDDVAPEVRGHWYRTLTLASLDVADERARAEAAELDEPWTLAIPAARSQAAEGDAETGWTWSWVMVRVILSARWLDAAPDDVAGAAVNDPPAWPGSAEVADAWHDGTDVGDHRGANEVLETLGSWLSDEVDDDAEVEEFAVEDEDDVDEAYLLAVLDRMHEGLVPGIALAAAAEDPDDDALADGYAQVYIDDAHQLEGWSYRIEGELDGEEVAQPVEDPEPRTYRNVVPLVVTAECVVALAEYDDSGWYGSDDSRWSDKAMELVEAEPAPPVNPTPWRIGDTANEPDPEWCA